MKRLLLYFTILLNIDHGKSGCREHLNPCEAGAGMGNCSSTVRASVIALPSEDALQSIKDFA